MDNDFKNFWRIVYAAALSIGLLASGAWASKTLQTAVDGSGTVTLNPSGGTYTDNSQVTATAVPATGWQFSYWTIEEYLPPTKATGPMPTHQATDVYVATNLDWTKGARTDTSKVYFGKSSSPSYKGETSGTHWSLDQLDYDTKYYWRIDSVGPGGTTTGDTWYFTTEKSGCSSAPMRGDVPANRSFSKALLPLLLPLLALAGWAMSQKGFGVRRFRSLFAFAVIATVGSGSAWADYTSTENPHTITMNYNKKATAHFVRIEYTLTTNVEGTGTVDRSKPFPYYYNDVVTLTAQAGTYYQFDHWSGDLTGSENPKNITITGNMSVTAHFVLAQGAPVTLTVNTDGLGTVNKAPNPPYYNPTNVQLTAVPGEGYVFDHWTGGLTGSTNPDTIALNMDKTVTAYFVPMTSRYYVDPNGSDSNNGSYDHPFATLAKARDVIRTRIASGLTEAITVYIRQGHYIVNDLTFTSSDSGTSSYGIAYKAYPGEMVTVAGGVTLDPNWFGSVSDPNILARIPSAAQAYVKECDLDAHGITNYGTVVHRGGGESLQTPAPMELMFDGESMTPARWPNRGVYDRPLLSHFTTITSTPDGHDGYRLGYSDNRIDNWNAESDPWIGGEIEIHWEDEYLPISAINTSSNIITVGETPNRGLNVGMYFFGTNLLCELDDEEEFYIDRSTGMLYFYPPGSMTGKHIVVSLNEKLMELVGVSYLTFDGITFESCRGEMVRVVSGSSNNLFMRCMFRGAGTNAVLIDPGTSTTSNGLEGCEIHSPGCTAVKLCGGDRYTLTPGDNYINNCYIHHVGRWVRQATFAVSLEDVGQSVTHCYMYYGPQIAIRFRHNDHLMRYNHIYRFCQETDDASVIYSYRDWGYRGNEFLDNIVRYVHSCFDADYKVHAIMLDGMSSLKIKRNIIVDLEGYGVLIGGGRDNEIKNNIVKDCWYNFFVDRRINDQIEWNTSGPWDLEAKIEEYDYTDPPWSTAYPDLADIMDAGEEEADEPYGNEIKYCLGYGAASGWIRSGTWGGIIPSAVSYVSQSNNIEDDDPEFVDEENANFNLEATSPCYSISGWETIPVNQIGMLPEAPTLLIAEDPNDPLSQSGGGTVLVKGYTEPWAHIYSATLDGQDVKSMLVREQNGAIHGSISLPSFGSSSIHLEIVVSNYSQPTTKYQFLSPAGSSNSLIVVP